MDQVKERAVLSSFRSREEAEGAAKKLRALGVTDMNIRSFSGAPSAEKDHMINPVTGDFESLASLSGDAILSSRDAGILQAASPINSGMADGDGMVTGFNWGLTVVAKEALVERVVRVIKDAGGFT